MVYELAFGKTHKRTNQNRCGIPSLCKIRNANKTVISYDVDKSFIFMQPKARKEIFLSYLVVQQNMSFLSIKIGPYWFY